MASRARAAGGVMKAESWRLLVVVLLALVSLSSGCAAAGAGSRPLVITSGSQLADLYWRGELTDTRGNRWNVWILPGIAPTLESAAESVEDAADFASEPLHGEFWENRAEEFRDGLEFSWEDALRDFLVRGIGRDWSEASDAIAANLEQSPFGWIPRIMANAFWGYLVKPLGRVVLAPVGAAGGLAWSLATPSLQLVARPVGGLTWIALAGVTYPGLALAYHQPCWLLCITNREPDESLDGSFGLEIIRPDGDPEQELDSPKRQESPEADRLPFAPPPLRREEGPEPPPHQPTYRTDPSYRLGFDRGFQDGIREGLRRAKERPASPTEPD